MDLSFTAEELAFRDEVRAFIEANVPAEMRPAAAVVMQAHLEKLAAEGRLPEGLHD